jgi:hypothetical protein
MGDAICRFNPVRGQGMSVACLEAVVLNRLLKIKGYQGDWLSLLGKMFLIEAEAIIEGPWRSSAIPDLAYPETQGERPANLDEILDFQRALARVAMSDSSVHKLLVEVIHLLKPTALFEDTELVRRVKAEIESWSSVTTYRVRA